jgi:RNA polymerase sigma-70 factor (ECF subfamily)
VTRRATQSAEDEALVSQLDHKLVVALSSLSPELRAVLQATVLDGLTTRETAVLLGIAEGTVKTRARRARLLLREALS